MPSSLRWRCSALRVPSDVCRNWTGRAGPRPRRRRWTARLREAGWGIALDDVGAEPASLALLPFVQPDVVKLDLRLVQR
nr:EAL domain-containing protein [Actinomycetota bacterium]